MIRHVALFRFDPAATAEQRQHLSDGLDELPRLIPGVLRYSHGPDQGATEGNYDYAVVAEFATLEDYLGYRDHEAHQALIRERLAPIRTERASLQFAVEG